MGLSPTPLRRFAVDLVDALLPPSCIACDGPTAGLLCATCLESVLAPPPSTIACAMFGGSIADAVRVAKFRPDATVAAALGALWVARIEAQQAPAIPDVDVVAFVPAPYRRRVKRGFDLPALLARSLAEHKGVPVVDALACTRHDEPLSFGADKAARATAVAGRYRLRPRASIGGKRVLLVDDVRTTGATVGECARVLGEGGAGDVLVATFAVAP